MKQLAVVGISFAFIFMLFAALMVPDVVRDSLTLSLRAISYALVVGTIVTLVYGIWSGLETLLTMRSERHKKQHEADIMFLSAPASDRAWSHERHTGEYRNLSLESRVIVLPRDDRQPTEDEVRTWVLYHQSLHAPRVVSEPAVPALPEPEERPVDVLSVVRQRGCYLVVGAMGSGKTTLLQWFAEERRRLGWHVAVIDPHSPPGKWPQGCEVIGSGRDFDAVGLALKRLLELMDRRYKQVSAGEVGENRHSGIAVVVEEYMAIYANVPDVARVLAALLTESRKASIDVAIGSHSRRVRSLGLDGKGDLMEGLTIIHLHRHRTGQREALIEDQSGQVSAVLPGEFQVLSPADDGLGLEILDRPAEPDDEALRVLALHAAGRSLKEISEAVWGPGKFGSFYNDRIRDIMKRWRDWQPG